MSQDTCVKQICHDKINVGGFIYDFERNLYIIKRIKNT